MVQLQMKRPKRKVWELWLQGQKIASLYIFLGSMGNFFFFFGEKPYQREFY